MEMCDIVDEFGTRTGRTVARGTRLAPDEYLLVVHVWIRDEAGRYLIQQRSLELDTEPGVWATTAGHVLADEDSLAAAIRETNEELGIQLSSPQLRRLDRLTREHAVQDVYLAAVSRDALGAPVAGPEVADWKWATKAELEQWASRGEFFPYSYLGRLPGFGPVPPTGERGPGAYALT